jgi:hypothetical protein
MTGLQWFALAALMVLALITSVGFHRGWRRLRRSARFYRNQNAPAAIRNLSLVMPVLALGSVPVLIALAPLSLRLSVDFPERVQTTLVFGFFAYFLAYVGFLLILLYRPPAWLVPSWLREEDKRIGYKPPPPDRFDRFLLLLGLPFVFAGAGITIVAVLVALRT